MFYLQNYEESDSENCLKRNDHDESFHSLNKTAILHSFDATQFIFKPRHVLQLILDSDTKDESISDLEESFTSQSPKFHSRTSHTNPGRNGEQEKIQNTNTEMKDWNQFEISTHSIQGCRRFSMASSISSFCDAEKKKPPIYESTPISKAMANKIEETLSSNQLNHQAGISSDYVSQSRIFNQSALRSQKNEGIRATNESVGDGKSIVTSCEGTNHKSSNNLIWSINMQDNLEKELRRTYQSDSHHTLLHQYGDGDFEEESGDNSNNNNNAPNCSKLHQHPGDKLTATDRDSLLLPKRGKFKNSDINNFLKPSNNQTLPLTNQIQEMINSFQTLPNCGQSDSYLSLPSSLNSRASSDAKKSSETLRGSKLGNRSMHVTTRKETMTTNQSQEWEEFEKIACNRNNIEKAQLDCEEFEREYLEKCDQRIKDVESGSKKTFENPSPLLNNPASSPKLSSSYKSSKPSLSSQSSPQVSSSPSNTRTSLGRSLRASDPKFLQLRDTYEFMRLSLGEGRPMGNRFFDHRGNDSTITLEPSLDDLIQVKCKVQDINASMFDSLCVKGQDVGLNYQVVHGVRVPFLLPSNNSSNQNIKTASNMTANNTLPISNYIIHKEMTLPKKMEHKLSPKQNIQQLQQEHCHSNNIITKGDQQGNQSAEEIMGNNLETPSTTSNSFLPSTKYAGIQGDLKRGFEPTDSASDHHITYTPLLHPAKSSDMNQYEFDFKSIMDAHTGHGCGAFTPELLDLECPSTLDSLDMLPEKIDVEGNVIKIAPTAWTISFSDESLEAKSLEELLRLKRPDIIKSLGKRNELLNCKYLTSDPAQMHSKFQAAKRGSKDSKYGQLGRNFTHHPCIYSKSKLSTNQSSLSSSHRPVASIHQCTTPTPKYCTPVNQDPRISKTLTTFKHASFDPQNNFNILPKSESPPLSSSAKECKVKPKPLRQENCHPASWKVPEKSLNSKQMKATSKISCLSQTT